MQHVKLYCRNNYYQGTLLGKTFKTFKKKTTIETDRNLDPKSLK